jgi:TonB-dependent SusC/RagA subfamily outer membrane receptor
MKKALRSVYDVAGVCARRVTTLVTIVLAILCSAGSVAAQTGPVAGRVIDAATRNPIVGAQIVVDGTQRGTLTDARGRFRIEGVPGTQIVLRAVMVGYRTGTEPARVGSTTVEIGLHEAAVELDEIVVTGQAGGTLKRAVGNSVAKVDATKITQMMPGRDVTRLINGRSPGVQVAPGTGMVGSGPRIRVRGAASLSLSDQPLVYVDGVRVDNDVAAGPQNQGYSSGSINRLGDFTPDDIESIEIIKGPAAATLYGTEASSGVIQIITKRGRTDQRTQWELNVRQGANWFSNPAGRVPLNWGRAPSGEVISVNLVQREADRGTPVFRTGNVGDYGLSVRGGSATTRYYVSGKYENSEGIDINNDLWRYSARTNLGFTPSPKWDINTSFGFVKADINLASDIGSGTLFNAMFSTNVDTAGPRRGFRSAPPEAFRKRSLADQRLARFTGSVQIQNKPLSFLTQQLTLGVDQTNEKNTTLNPFLGVDDARFFSVTAALGSTQVNDFAVTYNTVDYNATATFNISPKLSSAASAGAQYYRRITESLTANGTEFTGPGLSTVAGTARTTSTEDIIRNVSVGFFLQEQLGWQQRIFLTGAVRVDNNSAFGSNLSFVTYPKVSASWVVNEEPFWHFDAINTLRLRGAYGKSGKQPETFAALRTFKPVTINSGQGGVTPQFVGNPDLKPEQGEEFEIGLDAGAFDDRIGLNINLYSNRTRDAILRKALAPSGGFPGEQFINVGELSNKGAELQLNVAALRTDAAAWTVGFNISKNINEVVDVSGAASGITPNGAHYIRMGSNLDTPGIHLRHQEGLPAGSYFGKKVVSARLNNGIAVDVLCDGGEESASPVPCATAPEVFLGRTDPEVEGAFTTSLTLFKRLTLTGLLDFKRNVWHGENDTLVKCALFLTCEANFYPERFDPVFVAQIQSADWHTLAVSDASFVKLRDLSLSYSVPPSLSGKIGAAEARVTTVWRNIHTWTNWTSLDPETYFLSHQFDKWSQTFTPHPMSFEVSVNLTY